MQNGMSNLEEVKFKVLQFYLIEKTRVPSSLQFSFCAAASRRPKLPLNLGDVPVHYKRITEGFPVKDHNK